MALRILLLQIRNPGDPMAGHEHACFARMCGVAPERIDALNVAAAAPKAGIWREYDAVMVGGAGDYSMSHKPFPHQRQVIELVREIVERKSPLFGSCMGFHIAACALGGEVVADPPRREVGTFEISLTPAGRADPLFGKLTKTFHAHLGHIDRVERPPQGVSNLAFSERCGYQAFRIGDGPIYCTQFHPELDRKSNRERYDFYVGKFKETGGRLGYDSTEAHFLDIDPPVNLLAEFLKMYC